MKEEDLFAWFDSLTRKEFAQVLEDYKKHWEKWFKDHKDEVTEMFMTPPEETMIGRAAKDAKCWPAVKISLWSELKK